MTEPRRLTLAHSPDSDDAFMFYALAEHKIATEGLEFEHILRDIETLNQWAKEGRMDITALSVHAYAYVRDKYALLTHGASMGDGYGPVVVAREAHPTSDLDGATIAIPGLLTTAALALSLFQPNYRAVVMPFDEIMDAVKAGEIDYGLLIHEGQLTHANEGLTAVVDLGIWWKDETGLPLPLGVNGVRKDLGGELSSKISRVLRASIAYGLEHRQPALTHALSFARGMDTGVADRFVGMYVNELTREMGEPGQQAIRLMLDRAVAAGLIPEQGTVEFIAD